MCQSLHRHISLSISSAMTVLKKWKLICDNVSLIVPMWQSASQTQIYVALKPMLSFYAMPFPLG